MNSKHSGSEWLLISAAVLLLAAMHRADLIVIVVSIALLVAYILCSAASNRDHGQRKI